MPAFPLVAGLFFGPFGIGEAEAKLAGVFAGPCGGFKRGQQLASDKVNYYPLPNLYFFMLHRLRFDVEILDSSTRTVKGLELV